MSNPLAEYLSAIEARDAREKAHEEYINACEYCSLRQALCSKAGAWLSFTTKLC
jgi:hypothetical protein